MDYQDQLAHTQHLAFFSLLGVHFSSWVNTEALPEIGARSFWVPGPVPCPLPYARPRCWQPLHLGAGVCLTAEAHSKRSPLFMAGADEAGGLSFSEQSLHPAAASLRRQEIRLPNLSSLHAADISPNINNTFL